MNYTKRPSFWAMILSSFVLMLAFQNCGPAKLSGSAVPSASDDPNDQSSQNPTPTPTATPKGTPLPTPTPNGVAHIQSRLSSSSFMNVSSTNSGTPLSLWDRANAASEEFIFTAEKEWQVMGKCLSAPGNLGQYVYVSDCAGLANQKWEYSSTTGTIQSGNGLCVEVPNNNTTAGAPIALDTCTGQMNQQWILIY